MHGRLRLGSRLAAQRELKMMISSAALHPHLLRAHQLGLLQQQPPWSVSPRHGLQAPAPGNGGLGERGGRPFNNQSAAVVLHSPPPPPSLSPHWGGMRWGARLTCKTVHSGCTSWKPFADEQHPIFHILQSIQMTVYVLRSFSKAMLLVVISNSRVSPGHAAPPIRQITQATVASKVCDGQSGWMARVALPCSPIFLFKCHDWR